MKKILLTCLTASVLANGLAFAGAKPSTLCENENSDTGIWWNAMEKMNGELSFPNATSAKTVLTQLASGSEAGQKLSKNKISSLVTGDKASASLNIKKLLTASLNKVVASSGNQKSQIQAKKNTLQAYKKQHTNSLLTCTTQTSSVLCKISKQ